MSAQTGARASSPPQPMGRPKKNSIGSWFSKKFGKRAGEPGHGSNDFASDGSAGAGGTLPVRKGARPDERKRTSTLPDINSGAQRGAVTGQQSQFASAFTSDQAQGLANTLTVPGHGGHAHGSLTPPPQLDGIPTQEPLGAIDLPRSPRTDTGALPSQQQPVVLSSGTASQDKELASPPSTVNNTVVHSDTGANPSTGAHPGAAAPIPTAIISDAPTAQTNDVEPDTDDTSSLAHRDSIGNRTLDTTKSRASTKPTTLMSLDTREPTVLPTTHIAQPRRSGGDDSFGNPQHLSTGPREGSAIHFAPDNGSRSVSGQTGTSIAGEPGSTFINVPTYSRPHPNNNPHPSAIPADNASVLTLASSNAGMSLGGASRSQHHAPSLGGARSIGGSLMGDRRNSSDTSASLKALPPLSRRGSDSSSRTRESFAASSTGQNSHQAMYGVGAAGPGAPLDRVSLHRTPSQKTVATQMSIPLSTSASNAALHAYTKSEHAANGSQSQLAGSQQAHGTAENDVAVGSEAGHSDKPLEASASTDLIESQLTAQPESDALLKAQASNLAATEHDQALHAATHGSGLVEGDVDGMQGVKKDGALEVPGGPPVA